MGNIGPGAYDTKYKTISNNDAVKVTIKGKPEENFRNDSPGPGQYEPATSLVKDKSRSALISSHSKRSEIVSK